jgi:hypothetical protein
MYPQTQKTNLLKQLNEIIYNPSITNKGIFIQFKTLLTRNRWLTPKQQSIVVTTYRHIKKLPVIICDTIGHCEKGCGGVMTWGVVCKKGDEILFEISDRCSAHPLNDFNTACYYALTDSLVKLHQIGLTKKQVVLTTNSYDLAEEMNNKWRILQNSKHEQKEGCKKFLGEFENLKLYFTSKQYNHNINQLIKNQLRYSYLSAA